MDDYVKEHGFAGWFETSAKENINIEEAARALVNKVTHIASSLHMQNQSYIKRNYHNRLLFFYRRFC